MKHDFLIEKKKIIVTAEVKGINDFRDIKLILDTGASTSIIDSGAVIRLGFDLKKLRSGDRLMTVGGGVYSKTLKLPKFSLLGKDLINFEVNVLDMPTQITYYADGLIGMDFLLQFKNIKFDFDSKTVET